MVGDPLVTELETTLTGAAPTRPSTTSGNGAAPKDGIEPAPGRGSDGDAPPEGPGSLSKRLRRPETLASFAISLGILVFAVLRLDIDPGAVWGNVRQADPLPYAFAFVAFYVGFPLRAYRWRAMLGRVGVDRGHGHAVPGIRGLVEIFLLSWFANCVVPAKLGDAYRAFLLKRRSGASFSTTFGTIVSERLIDLSVMFVAMSAVGIVVFRGHIPARAAQAFLFGLVLVAVAVGGLATMWLGRHALQRRLPERVREQYGRLHDAVFACLRRPFLFLSISVVIWLLEGIRLLLVGRALGVEISFTTALFVALMGSLLTTLPITPAGLGLVEGATAAVLVAILDMQQDVAASIAILDRVIGYWSIIVVGAVLYVFHARRDLG